MAMDARSRSTLPPIFWKQHLTRRAALSRGLFVVMLGFFLTSGLVCAVAAIRWVVISYLVAFSSCVIVSGRLA